MNARRLLPLLSVLLSVLLLAQGRWEAPYRKGTDAFKAKKWQEAITNLEAAVKLDPKEEVNKTSEGAFGTDYFPYYYLGVAHLRLGHFDKAEEYLQLAAKDRIQKLQPLIAAAENELATAKPKPQPANAQPTAAPPPPPKPNPTPPATVNPPPNPVTPPVSNPSSTKPAEPAKSGLDPKFEPLLRSAQTALDGRHYTDAIQRFDDLKAVDSTEYARRGLASRRTEAARGRALELTQEGLAILRDKNGKLAEAKSKFQEAQRMQPSAGASDGLAEVARRELAAASVNEPKPTPPAPAPMPAPPPPPAPTTPASPDFTVVPLQEALLEYLKGNVPRTIALLEPAARADNGTMDKRVRAPLHAYLAAAYADRSLVSRADDEKKTLERQALAQFKIALEVSPDFELSETAVSPAIRELLKKAGGR